MNDLNSLADAMGGTEPIAAKAAKVALEKAAHAAGAPKVNATLRRETIGALTQIAKSSRPRMVRAHVLRLLGLIAGRSELRALALLERDPEVGEDARMALQRIMRGGK